MRRAASNETSCRNGAFAVHEGAQEAPTLMVDASRARRLSSEFAAKAESATLA
jgi:hypothetical protein